MEIKRFASFAIVYIVSSVHFEFATVNANVIIAIGHSVAK